mmetsp:Transcript_16055/g.20999  ORF Transcript_16055/g.20999 Transcript_16055/m.20999 type:complete len:258 (+) Transcript_16055:42-815(+)
MSRQFKPDELIVNYHDACIYGRDLELVQSPREWLNDACIHFYLTVLQKSDTCCNHNNNTIFMDPSVISFLMHQCQDDEDLQEFAAGACGNFQTTSSNDEGLRLVVPINDHFLASQDSWAIPGAGMHWSLLVLTFSKQHQQGKQWTAWHLDSAGGNLAAASRVAETIHHAQSLLTGNDDRRIEDFSVMECKVPRQQNGYDCGTHVLSTAEAILPLPPSATKTDIEQAVQLVIDFQAYPNYCVQFRSKVAGCILGMREE